MKKVLIVSPHFAPINAPDMQRTRLALPYFRQYGWEPVILALTPESIEGGVNEPLLELTYPPDIRIVRVQGFSSRFTRRIGFGSLWLRCGRALRTAGEKLLREEKFDLVFFSTTQFDAFPLGPRWLKRFGVPYVLDYQDPWVNDYYARTQTRPPGGALKFALSQWRARSKEPKTLKQASGIVAVSDSYGRTLAARYPWFSEKESLLLPFGAAAKDIETARQHKPAKPLVDFDDGHFHHIYAGRCGPDMSISLTTIFRSFRHYLDTHAEKAKKIRFHFIGTDYAPPPLGREWAMPIAKAEGIAEYVTEHCYRVPYFDALYYIVQADALLAVGSNDPTYSASKIFPYILANRPMLVVFNNHSPVLAFARQANCGQRFGFNDSSDIESLVYEISRQWFFLGGMKLLSSPDPAAFEPFTAEAMTQKLTACFDVAITKSGS